MSKASDVENLLKISKIINFTHEIKVQDLTNLYKNEKLQRDNLSIPKLN